MRLDDMITLVLEGGPLAQGAGSWRTLSLPVSCGSASGLLVRALVFSKTSNLASTFTCYLRALVFSKNFQLASTFTCYSLWGGSMDNRITLVSAGLWLGARYRNLDSYYCSPWQLCACPWALGARHRSLGGPDNCGPVSGLLG